MSKKVVTLLNSVEMLERLLKVNDSMHLQEYFYPILLKQAGQERYAGGVVMMVVQAINEYLDRQGTPLAIVHLMSTQAPSFIDALVSDVEIAKEAKRILEEVLPTK